jgi:hypothetical protein
LKIRGRALGAVIAVLALAAVPASCAYPTFSFGVPLPCGSNLDCLIGQVCCFAPFGGDAVCRLSGQCPLAHVELGCRLAIEDCPASQSCCAVDQDHDGFPDVVQCQGACAVGDVLLCDADRDCPEGKPCLQIFPGLPGYRGCKP